VEPPAQSALPAGEIERTGVVQRFTFRNPENGFAVLRVKPERGEAFLAVGPLAELVEGQQVRLQGRLVDHPRFGAQLQVSAFTPVLPSTTDGIISYLGSRLVKGIGPATARRIVARFGADTLTVIEQEPQRLTEVKGLGPRRIAELVSAVRAQHDVQQVLVFLRAHGLGPGLATRIVRHLGAGASTLIQSNPYRLADEVLGIGFKTADRLASSLGIAADAPDRIRAGTLFALAQASKDGHCFLPQPELARTASEMLACDPRAIEHELPGLFAEGRIVVEQAPGPRVLTEDEPLHVYPVALHEAEVGVAQCLHRLAEGKPPRLPFRAATALAWFERSSRMQLHAGQRQAIVDALEQPISVITGGPGVGKTTIVRAIAAIFRAKNLGLLLAAPTGRAAKRLEEATGQQAMTLHRLLEFNPGLGIFQRAEHAPLEGDLLVVDEASMLDVQLAHSLLRAVPPAMRLVLVGDSHQLPSVGPGNVLADVIASGRVAVTALTQIFRQASGSAIVTSAHRVLHGEMPESGGDGSDFFVVEAADGARLRATVKELVLNRIPKRFGFDPLRDIQVLCPMYRGDAGADTINRDLQDLLNPGRVELERGGRTYREGDKVMQIKNDYDLELFNGDLGVVLRIDKAEAVMLVRFGERAIEYPFQDLDQLVPAFAISVHRAQGSEYPAVVVTVATDHFVMLRRNLLYTAITRGKRLVVLVGSKKAIGIAVRNHAEARRNSALAERLRDLLRAQAN
jgi:exodeoxyribonuclease V alpha subunit